MQSYNDKFSLSLSPTFNLGEKEQIERFLDHGIGGFFALYSDYNQVASLKEFAEKKGAFFQSIHAKHHPMREMWFDGEKTEYILSDIKETIISAKRVGVDKVIMHLYTGFLDEHPNEIGVKRAGELLEVAEKHGVKLCFENLEGTDFLDAVLTEYSFCDYARLCYDTGHENCYGTHQVVDKHKDKIFALHINDNMGIRSPQKTLTGADDLHLLPFDGNVDFNRVISLIKNAKLENELTFELKFSKDELSNKYREMSFDAYLDRVKQSMEKLARLF